MKICVLAPEFPPVWGGVGTYIGELVRHLPKKIEVHVVTPIRGGLGSNGRKHTFSGSDFTKKLGSNVHIHFVCKANDTFFYNALFQYACMKHVPKLLKDERIDLIHSHTAHMPDLLLMLRRLKKPIITTVHTTIKSQRLGTRISRRRISDLERSEKATYIMYPILRLAEELYFLRKRFYITPSNWMKIWLRDNFHINEDIRVIPNSLDIDDFELRNNLGEKEIIPQEIKDKRMILYVGRLLAMKGIDVIVEAIPKILKRAKKDDICFVFAGPGNPLPYIDKAKKIGIESSCFFVGSLSRENVIQYMKNSELVVVPSFIENTPYTILEAMACGVPVVANKIGGIPEIIKHRYNGILVEQNSSVAIAESIINLLEDKQSQRLMGQHAKETIRKKFSWSVNLEKYCDTYSYALSK